MDSDDEYYRRAQAALDRAKVKRGGYRGDCRNCAHVRLDLVSNKCVHPAVVLVAFNLTDAYDKKRIQSCDEQRDAKSVFGPVVCGPNGVLFEEAKSTSIGAWFRKLFA